MSRPAEFPVGAQGGGSQSVASAPLVGVTPAGPTPATFTTLAAVVSAAGVVFFSEERA